MNTPNGYVKVQAWEVFVNGKDIVILGDANSIESHNCDEMGCGSLDHVLYRGSITKGAELRDAEQPSERKPDIQDVGEEQIIKDIMDLRGSRPDWPD